MNHTPFWPLVWKEYRSGRAFWVAMAVMGLLAQASVRVLSGPTERNWWLYAIALMISAGFAVGIGGTLFAAEHEERTFALLRVLPVRAKELGWAKLLCASAGLGLLLVALWLAASALAGWQALPSDDARQLWGLWGLACAEGLAYGILCSLAIRSPLWATATAVMVVTLAVQTAVTLTETHDLTHITSYTDATPFRIVLLIAVAALDAWLLPRWLDGRFPQAKSRASGKTSDRAAEAEPWQSPAPSWAVPLGRLMWQSWCETLGSAWRFAGLALVAVLVCGVVEVVLLTGILDFGQVHSHLSIVNGLRLVPLFVLLPPMVLAALAGTLTFSLDPTWRARFLAERGISPRLVWLSRQIVWGGWLVPLLAMSTALTLVPLIVPPPSYAGLHGMPNYWGSLQWSSSYFETAGVRTQPEEFRLSTDDVMINGWLFFVVLLSTYAAAQLISIVCGRRLLAAVLAIVVGSLAGAWADAMFALDIPWWWSVLPLPLACLAATWLRAPAWLRGETAWRPWLAPVATVLGSMVLIGAAVPNYRVDEVPLQPDVRAFWPVENDSPAELADARKTIDLYKHAYEMHRLGPETDVSRDAHREQVARLLIEAGAHKSVWLPTDPAASWQLAEPLHELGDWLADWAGKRQDSGQLDQSLDAYVAALQVANHLDQCRPTLQTLPSQHLRVRYQALEGLRSWAARQGQTAQQIRDAIQRLQAAHTAELAPPLRLRAWYAAVSLRIEDLPAALAAEGATNRDIIPEHWLVSQLPWERKRALRLLDIVANIELCELQGYQLRLKDNFTQDLQPNFGYVGDGDVQSFLNHGQGVPQFTQLMRTTPLIDDRDIPFTPQAWLCLREQTDYRASLIAMALEAWRIEHGALPETLDQLVPTELESVPLDPVYAQPFQYFPQGKNEQNEDWLVLHPDETDAQDQPPRGWPYYDRGPFLWSALGPMPDDQSVRAYYGQENRAEIAYYGVAPRREGSYRPSGVLPGGRAYQIPQPRITYVEDPAPGRPDSSDAE